jgi:hypothetical protein
MGAPDLRPFDGPDRVVAHGDHLDRQAIQQRCKDMSLQPHHGLRVTVICVALVLIAAAALTIGFNGLTN